jgi:oligopeptide/dipeptide ABC transporter ATP-binding protein
MQLAVSLQTVSFAYPGGVPVLRDVDLDITSGEFVGIAGPNGGGKTTLIRLALGLERPTGGTVRLFGQPALSFRGRARIGFLAQRSVVDIDAPATVRELVGAGRVARSGIAGRFSRGDRLAVAAAIERVGLADRADTPVQRLSGGQQQRAAIAKALAGEPDLLILDEPTSALDVTTQAQLLDELSALRARLGASLIFISHDIALLSGVADTIVVMYAGQICEHGPRDEVIDNPKHPYTQALLSAVERIPVPGGRLAAIPGDPPDPTRLPPGCPFAPRCPYAMPVCTEVNPALTVVGPDHAAACHLLDGAGETARRQDGKTAVGTQHA